jgi:hypothetical protein
MKKYFLLLSMLATVFCAHGQLTDAQLTTLVDPIRNNTVKRGITKEELTSAFQGIIDNKISKGLTRNRQTDNYTLVLTDNFKLVEMNAATAKTITVPLNSTVAFPVDNTQISIGGYGAGTVTIVATGGVTIRSADGALALRTQYSSAVLIKIGTNEWYLIGDLE